MWNETSCRNHLNSLALYVLLLLLLLFCLCVMWNTYIHIAKTNTIQELSSRQIISVSIALSLVLTTAFSSSFLHWNQLRAWGHPYHLPCINSSIFKAFFINRFLFSFLWLCVISWIIYCDMNCIFNVFCLSMSLRNCFVPYCLNTYM